MSSIIIPKPKSAKSLQISHLLDFAKPKSTSLRLPKKLNAGVIKDKAGHPQFFIFDRHAFWDMLCRIDELYADKVSDKVYYKDSPVGWLIDEIEANWPFSKEAIRELEQEVKEAESDISQGKTLSLKELSKELGLL